MRYNEVDKDGIHGLLSRSSIVCVSLWERSTFVWEVLFVGRYYRAVRYIGSIIQSCTDRIPHDKIFTTHCQAFLPPDKISRTTPPLEKMYSTGKMPSLTGWCLICPAQLSPSSCSHFFGQSLRGFAFEMEYVASQKEYVAYSLLIPCLIQFSRLCSHCLNRVLERCPCSVFFFQGTKCLRHLIKLMCS